VLSLFFITKTSFPALPDISYQILPDSVLARQPGTDRNPALGIRNPTPRFSAWTRENGQGQYKTGPKFPCNSLF